MAAEHSSPEESEEPTFSSSVDMPDESMDRLKGVGLRPETPEDYAEVEALLDDAFGPDANVAELVRQIRDSPNYVPQFSLIAEKGGRFVGHVMLSHTDLREDDITRRVLNLSPLAVRPSEQGSGIGGQLIRNAVEVADAAGEGLIVLEGSPKYYPRFGFRPASELGIRIDLPSWAPPEAAMALPLTNYDPSFRGQVHYPPAFDVTQH